MNAIILAGGRGSRLAPWDAPKCLMPINGVPILQRLMTQMIGSLVDAFVICIGYRAPDVESSVLTHGWNSHFFRMNNPRPLVQFSDAGDVAMGARLHKARRDTDSERLLILYGDELADVDIAALVKQHEVEGNTITFAAAYQKVVGGMVFNKTKPVSIVENQRFLVNIGFVLVDPECWPLLKAEDGLSDWINRVSGHGLPVGVYHHEGKRATVNSLADLKYAEEVWK